DAAEAQVTIASACTPDAAETPNNAASSLTLGNHSPVYNFCTASGAVDVDWVSMQVEGGKKHIFGAIPVNSSAGFTVTLYNSTFQKVKTWSSKDLGTPLVFAWSAEGSDETTYYAEIR